MHHFAIHHRSIAIGAVMVVASFAVCPRAQVHVEEEVSSDSVDVFSQNDVPEKSAALAMISNLLLPGLGHYWLGNRKAAVGYFCTEATFIFGALACNTHSKGIANSAHAFAFTNAQVRGGEGANYFFWENVGKTMDSDGLNQSRPLGYNQVMDLNRASDNDKYLSPNLQWRWIDEESRIHYNKLIKQSLRYKVASNFFLGAMLLNRIVSFIDIRVASRNNGRGLLSNLQFSSHYDPQTGASGLVCTAGF